MEDRGWRIAKARLLHRPSSILHPRFLDSDPYNAGRPTMTDTRADRTILTAPGTIDHHVGDLTATIAADVALVTVQDTLGAMGQWLPIDGDPQMPVGQLVETNSTGP